MKDLRWPERLAEVLSIVTAELRAAGCNNPDRCGEAAVLGIARAFDGRSVYLAKAHRVRVQLRRERMRQRADGRRAAEIAKEFGVSERTVYRALAEQ